MADTHSIAKWKAIVKDKILPAFPNPWADHGSDAKFERYIASALHHLDGLKSPGKDGYQE